jgi:hypothetical protein
MRSARKLLWLLAIPLLMSATPPTEPALKDVLVVSVRGDSGSAQRFTLVARGFLTTWGHRGVAARGSYVVARDGQDMRTSGVAPDTLRIFGTGSAELASADSGKPVVVDVWVISQDTSGIQRFSGKTLKIERASPTSGYSISP